MKTRPDHRFLRSGIRASLSFFAGLLIHASAFAQLPYLFDFSSDPFAAGWTEVSVTGDQSWQYNASFNNVTMNPFSGGCQINEDWLITPAFDLTGSTDESLSFDIQRAFSGDNDLEVLYSTDYSGSGDPNAAAWSSITLITNQFFEDNSIPSNTSETFGPFSDLQSASTSAVYIAFKAEYISGGCATWRVADFALTSASEPAIFASPAALSGFEYTEGEGPSASQSFLVTAQNLSGSGNVTVTAPSGYEVSDDDDSYGASADLAYAGGTIISQPRTVFLRLAEGLSPGAYAGNVTLEGGGADAQVAADGNVSAAPAPGTYIVDFEGPGETKGSYASGTVNLSGIDWNMTEALIGTAPADFKNGERSARLRGYGNTSITMLQDKPGGIGTLSFVYARYGSDQQVPHVAEYSTDGGENWIQIGDEFTGSASPVNFFAEVNEANDARIRIRTVSDEGTLNRRTNIDDIALTDFGAADPQLFASPAALPEFFYTVEQGPSADEFFILSASALDPAAGNISVTAPSGFEVSADNGTWSTSLNIAYTDGGAIIDSDTVYVRLSAGLAVGAYDGNVSCEAGAAVTAVAVSGTVGDSPNPELFNLAAADYLLEEWSSESEAGTYPPNMRFFFSDNPTSPAFNPLADGTRLYDCGYDVPSRSRINGNDDAGFSFLATGSAQFNNCVTGAADSDRFTGSAVIGLNTEGVSFARISWLNRILTDGERPFVVRLQYRLSDAGDYTDFPGNPGFASTGLAEGDSSVTDYIFPSAVLGQSEVYLRLVYYQDGPGGGARPEIGIDDLLVTTAPLTAPFLGATESAVSDLYYTDGEGPSAPVTYTLSGENLDPSTGVVTAAVSGDFEISINGTDYDTLLTLGYGGGSLSEDISVRLKEGLEIGTYTGSISHTGGSANPVNINLSGEVGYPVNLTTADIAIIGFRSVANDGITFAAWTDIPDETIIIFTDNGFTGTELRKNENTAVWKNTSGAAIPAGSVVKIGGPEFGDGEGVSVGELISGNLDGLAQAGDNIFAIQGSLSVPVWLHGLSYLSEWLTEGPVGNATSYLPEELDIPAGNIVILERNGEYDEAREGEESFAAYQDLVHDPENWRTEFDGAEFGDFDTTPFTLGALPCNANGGTLTALSPVSVCVGTGEPQGVNIQLTGAVGQFGRYGLLDTDNNVLDVRAGNANFNLDVYPPGQYRIRHLRYEADVNAAELASLTNASQLADVEGCWASSNTVNVFLSTKPEGGTLTATSPTTVCAASGSQTVVTTDLTGATGFGSRFFLVNLGAAGNPVIANNSSGDFNLNPYGPGTFQVRHLSYAQGVNLTNVASAADLQGCFSISNGVTVSVVNCGAAIAASPNPTAAHSFVTFTNPREEYATLEVYDTSGRLLERLFSQTTVAGQEYRTEFDASQLPVGVYICRLTTESETVTEKLLIAR